MVLVYPTVLAANNGFEECGTLLGREVMAAALIDRLLHHCHIVNIRGNSYRMREHQLTGCGPRRKTGARESPGDRQPSSLATPDGHQRENANSAREVLPERVQFSIAIDSSRMGRAVLVSAQRQRSGSLPPSRFHHWTVILRDRRGHTNATIAGVNKLGRLTGAV